MVYIGDVVKARMDLFGFTLDRLNEESMLPLNLLEGIIENKISISQIDDFDLNVLASTLYCEPDYFVSEDARNSDVVFASHNRGECTHKSNLVKAKLQNFMKDLLFLKSIG